MGSDVLEVIRGDPATRPSPDSIVIEAARSLLEGAAAAWAGSLPDDVVVRVTKDAVGGVRRCEVRHLTELALRFAKEEEPRSAALLRGRMLDALFRQVAVTGVVGPDPLADAIAAGRADGEDGAQDLLGLGAPDQLTVRAEVTAATERLVADWPSLPPGSSVRTQERVLVSLAGGRVLLSGRPDVTIGRPSLHRAGVVVLEAKSGGFRPAHLDEVRFYALLEALRWGVAPFRVVVWSLGDGRIEAVDVDADLVWSEALRVADAITRLTRLAAGEAPRPSANPLCPSCPRLADCADGSRQVALAGGAWPPPEPDDDAGGDGSDERDDPVSQRR